MWSAGGIFEDLHFVVRVICEGIREVFSGCDGVKSGVIFRGSAGAALSYCFKNIYFSAGTRGVK